MHARPGFFFLGGGGGGGGGRWIPRLGYVEKLELENKTKNMSASLRTVCTRMK